MAFDTLTVTIVRPGGRNPYGDDTGATTEFDVDGCLFAPGPSREPGFESMQVQTDGTVYGPAGIDVRPTDRMRVRGDLYSVVGDPQNWGSSGTVVALKRYTG